MWVVVWLRKLWYNNNKINLADLPFLSFGTNWNELCVPGEKTCVKKVLPNSEIMARITEGTA